MRCGTEGGRGSETGRVICSRAPLSGGPSGQRKAAREIFSGARNLARRAQYVAMAELPSGTVTFLFSDVEGSTHLLERHGAALGRALARHHELFEQIVERHGGGVFESVGDAVYAAFSDASAAGAAALDAQRALATEDWGPINRLAARIALHTGSVERRGAHYFGPALFRVARLQALGYGGQTLLSEVTARLAADALPGGASLRDLGTYRLKDLGEPEHVYQLVHRDLPSDFPALKSLDAHPHHLPMQLSSFVGRDTETAALRQLLGQHRLVTLLGPGGIGKTRLALQVAADAFEEFPDGVFFVDLAAVRDPALVPRAIAAVLHLRELPGTTMDQILAEHVHASRILLVLDNFEQLPSAAAASVGELLAAAPDLHIMVTSRAPLRIRGEHEYPVPPLGLTPRDPLETSHPPALALFVERGRAVRPDFALDEQTERLVTEACAELDGLPLAIELAAARLRVFTVAQLHDRLTRRLPLLTDGPRDLPERHHTLRAAIAWSEELVPESERRLFWLLGAFVGGFTIDAAENVSASGSGDGLLSGLSGLVEHSLIRPVESAGGEPRFEMLATIREYALERLNSDDSAAETMRRHAEYFRDFAESNAHLLDTPQRDRVLELYDLDHGNLRAAIEWAIAAGDSELAWRLAVATASYWQARSKFSEGRDRLDSVLGLVGDASEHRARCFTAAAGLATWHGDQAAARRYAGESLAVYRAIGDQRGAAETLTTMGWATIQDDPPEARRLLAEASSVFRDLGDDESLGGALRGLAAAELTSGDVARARGLLEESLAAYERTDEQQHREYTRGMLGWVQRLSGDFDAARLSYRQMLQAAHQGGALVPVGIGLDCFADLALVEDDPFRSIRLAAAANALRDRIGGGVSGGIAGMEPILPRARASVAADDFLAAQLEGEAMGAHEAVRYALDD